MTESAIRRGARAIFNANAPVGGLPHGVAPLDNQPASVIAHYEGLFRAGIAAVREPNEGMIAAGRYNHARDAEVWRVMIDAMLAEDGEKSDDCKERGR